MVMKNVCAYLGAVVVGVGLVSGAAAPAGAQTPTKAAPAKAAAAAAPKGAARVVKLTADDTMKFDVTTIEAKPGEALEVQLTSKGTAPKEAMAHNFVLLNKGTDPNAFAMDAGMARDTGYIPAKYKANVIASTALVGPGETVKVTFAAPKVPGSYTYMCSFAGHFLTGMKGTLIVK
jgi:azurin